MSAATSGFRSLIMLGILAGILWLAYEVRQSNAFAHERSVANVWTSWTAISRSEIDSRVPDAFVKAMTDADNLTLAEQFVLNSWLTAQMNTWEQDFTTATMNGGPAQEVAEEAGGAAPFLFGNKFTRGWYLENKSWISPELVTEIDKTLADTPLGSDLKVFKSIMDQVP